MSTMADPTATLAYEAILAKERLEALLLAIVDGAAKSHTDAYGLVHYDLAVSPVVAQRIDHMQNMEWPK